MTGLEQLLKANDEEEREDLREYLRVEHNIFVDLEAGMINRGGEDAVYGWEPIPPEWIQDYAETSAGTLFE